MLPIAGNPRCSLGEGFEFGVGGASRRAAVQDLQHGDLVAVFGKVLAERADRFVGSLAVGDAVGADEGVG